MSVTVSELLHLEAALVKYGNRLLLQYWGTAKKKHLEQIRRDLNQFVKEYKKRFPEEEKPDPFALLDANPTKAGAFFHLDTLLASLEMKIMIWRILIGFEIDQVDLAYKAGKKMSLRFVLRCPGRDAEHYETENSADLRVLRHFSLTAVNESYVFQGYYALQGGH
jgi:hypothetical protein